MRNPFRRAVEVPGPVVAAAALVRDEQVLAGTPTRDGGWLLGTRDALVVVPPGPGQQVGPVQPAGPSSRIPWERIQHADWSRDEERLVVTEVGEFGRVRPRHSFSIDEPGLLLELIRERVTASVVLQHRVAVSGKRGLFVIARRAPRGDGDLTWAYEFDRGVDPADPAVMEAAERGLAAAREQLGL